mmetsp:Transcript_70307/g.164691  ORF Transcript_70307/g.164691 Transcript_70307/m.164691 type:complete len:221 (-) Transcript_70307:882-1544(-)
MDWPHDGIHDFNRHLPGNPSLVLSMDYVSDLLRKDTQGSLCGGLCGQHLHASAWDPVHGCLRAGYAAGASGDDRLHAVGVHSYCVSLQHQQFPGSVVQCFQGHSLPGTCHSYCGEPAHPLSQRRRHALSGLLGCHGLDRLSCIFLDWGLAVQPLRCFDDSYSSGRHCQGASCGRGPGPHRREAPEEDDTLSRCLALSGLSGRWERTEPPVYSHRSEVRWH